MSANYEKAKEIAWHLMTNDELNAVVDQIRIARQYLGRQAIREIQPKDVVTFKGRKGLTITGTVSEVKTKNLVVVDNATGLRWRVAANLATKV